MATLNTDATDQLDVVAHAHSRGCGVLIKRSLDSGKAARDAEQRRRNLHFAANVPGVSSVVIGTTNPAHLLDNAAAFA